MLPVLVVLFLLSYALMTLLIVEQGSTIDSQRTLIGQLLKDSFELSSLKGKAVREQALSRQAQPKDQAGVPSAQAPSTQTPSSATPESTSKAKKNPGGRSQRALPAKPPQPASDMADVRRVPMSI